MKTDLLLLLNPEVNPYLYDYRSKYEIWGEVKLQASDCCLLDLHWNVLPIYEWFIENKEYLLKERLPFEVINGESIVECRDRLYSRDSFKNDQEEDRYYEILAEYFIHHYFKISGTNTDLYYIGLNKNDVGEISGYKNNKLVVFEFDMELFLRNAFAEFDRFFNLWQSSFYSEEAYLRWMEMKKMQS